MKKTVLLRAPLLTVSGYGVHSRQVFEWLESREDIDLSVEILRWGLTSWNLDSKIENGIVGRIMSRSKAKKDGKKYDVSIQVQLPDEWDPNIAIKNIGISAVVETDRCSKEWLKRIDMMDLVIVPSTFAKKVIHRTGKVETPVVVVPEWFKPEIEKENIEKINLDLDTSFNFLTIGQFTGGDPYTDRKNLYFLIKWFCEVFKDDKDVGLVIKSNHGKSTKIDREITKTTFKNVLNEVRQGDYPKIHLIHGNLNQDEIVSLYRRKDIKAYVTITRGEGYGLPIVDAAASGLPVIATNWSGHLEFMNMGKFVGIDYDLKEIPNHRIDKRVFYPGFRWAEPKENDFKRKILKFRNKYTLPQQWASDLSQKVINRFSKKSTIELYNSIFDNFYGKL